MAWTFTIIWLYTTESVVTSQNILCHHQRSFAQKMHQNRWRLGLRPRPPSWIKWPTSKGRGEVKGGEGKGGGEGLWTLTMFETD